MENEELTKMQVYAAERQASAIVRYVHEAFDELSAFMYKSKEGAKSEQDYRILMDRISFILEAAIKYYHKGKVKRPYAKTGARQNLLYKKIHNR